MPHLKSGSRAMAFDWTLSWSFALGVCAFAAAQHEAGLIQNCTAQADQLSSALKQRAEECGENLTLHSEESASALLSVMKLKDSLHIQQLKDCQGAQPRECPEADVPRNGGLVCVTVANRRYCKPMCNNGFDFAFIRRSRLYDECSEQTKYKWDSQYIGGRTLAVCNQALLQISGKATAYFPKNQNCLTTKSSRRQQNDILSAFINELKDRHLHAEQENACLVCGEQSD